MIEYTVINFRDNKLTGNTVSSLDALFQLISIDLLHQSERRLPRFNFSKGFSNLTKTTAVEFNGIVIVLILAIRSDLGMYELTQTKKTNKEDLNEYCGLFELLICLLWWFKKTNGFKRDDASMDHYQNRIRYLLRKMKRIVNRKTGNGFKLKKFHQLLHTVFLIKLFGAPANSDGGPCERNQKFMAKGPYATTQKRVKTAHLQTSSRYVDYLAIDLAYKKYNCDSLIPDVERPVREEKELQGTQYRLHRDEEEGIKLCVPSWKRFAVHGQMDKLPSPYVLSFLSERVSKYLPNDTTLHLFTEHRRNDIMFRSHPWYRSTSEWFDWAMFDFGDYKQSAQILAFVDLETNFSEEDLKPIRRNNGVWIGDDEGNNRKGWYAIVNELKRNPNDEPFVTVPTSRIVGHGEREHHQNGQLKLSLVHIESLDGACVIINNPQVEGDDMNPFKVLLLRNPDDWAGLFENGTLYEENDPDLVPAPVQVMHDDDEDDDYVDSNDEDDSYDSDDYEDYEADDEVDDGETDGEDDFYI